MSRSSIGRVLLIHRSDSEIAPFAEQANAASTLERALINPTVLVDRVREARDRGYAYTDQYTAGICAIGVPVKIGLGRDRSEERSVGKECVSTGRSRRSRRH